VNAGITVDRARLAFRDALWSLRVSPLLAASGATAVALALLLVALSALTIGQSRRAVGEAGEELVVKLFLDETMAEEEMYRLQREIAESPLVEQVAFRTTDQERARLVDVLGEELLRGVDEEAIPAQPSVDVLLRGGDLDEGRFDRMRALVETLTLTAGVEKVRFDADHVPVIFALGGLVLFTGTALCLLALGLALAFLALLTRAHLHRRAKELALVRSFGATDATIYAPTVVMSALVGLSGGIIALLVATLVDTHLAELVRRAPELGPDLSLLGPGLLTWCLLGGVAIASAGGWLTIARHRRVR